MNRALSSLDNSADFVIVGFKKGVHVHHSLGLLCLSAWLVPGGVIFSSACVDTESDKIYRRRGRGGWDDTNHMHRAVAPKVSGCSERSGAWLFLVAMTGGEIEPREGKPHSHDRLDIHSMRERSVVDSSLLVVWVCVRVRVSE
mmetsp:Transcript_22701/g.64922  ORF Transcript_22701/g.64922 Transcript_22701/m.64922 type:complete len:143 (-) Transcript_22701:229-657(-)